MTVKVLIVDPDISFTVPIKRALEISGDYKVNVFASAQAALELLMRDEHDVAIVDFRVEDVELPLLVEAMREIQPWLFILASPRNADEIARLAGLDIQGSITKPYFARQLGPVIREAALTRARGAHQSAVHARDLDDQLEPALRPDDTFEEMVATLRLPEEPTAADPRTLLAEPLIPDDATVRDLVSAPPAPEVPPT